MLVVVGFDLLVHVALVGVSSIPVATAVATGNGSSETVLLGSWELTPQPCQMRHPGWFLPRGDGSVGHQVSLRQTSSIQQPIRQRVA